MKKDQKNQTNNETESLRPDLDSAINSDVLGSYTGMPMSRNGEDPYEKPIQDADDL